MDLKVTTLDGKEAGSVTLNKDIFGLEPRTDLIQRCVVWQLAKRRAGTHAVKNRADINRTGKKSVAQKGSGGARHGSMRANLFRGGGRSFGPHPREPCDRPAEEGAGARAAPCALRQGEGRRHRGGRRARRPSEAKTKALSAQFEKLGLANALIIGGDTIEENFGRAARNIPNIDVLPVQGINVYDILRRQKLVLTKAAVEALEARFK